MKKKIIILILSAMIVLLGVFVLDINSKREYMSYQDFYKSFEVKDIDSVYIMPKEIEFSLKEDEKVYYTVNPNSVDLEERLLIDGIEVNKDTSSETFEFIFDLLFYVFFFGIVIIAVSKLMELYVKTFKIVKNTNVSFENIAGMSNLKKEMMAVVDILKDQKESAKKGIRPIKGIILEGPPGNGKTLFAKALAKEAKVNFIASKGADFQSALMSMGSKKIKMLFNKAKKHKPCIIFIDEFDSIGERRNYAGTGVDKENNRIITTMLNEMDGFENQEGILVIAATNSYASLDSALIRPGRFDLKYNISNPDKETREELINIYTKDKKIASDISKEALVNAFENLSCSAIETILNESAMLAQIDGRDEIIFNDVINSLQKTGYGIIVKKLI